eukprot:6191795-Pleurochrysis_carterae.AAC.1
MAGDARAESRAQKGRLEHVASRSLDVFSILAPPQHACPRALAPRPRASDRQASSWRVAGVHVLRHVPDAPLRLLRAAPARPLGRVEPPLQCNVRARGGRESGGGGLPIARAHMVHGALIDMQWRVAGLWPFHLLL